MPHNLAFRKEKRAVILSIFVAMSFLFFLSQAFGSRNTFARTFGGPAHDGAYSVIQAMEGGFVLAGMTMSFGAGNKDFLVFRLDSAGDLLWARTFGGPGADYAHSVIQTGGGGFTVAGSTNSFGAGDLDALVIRLDSSGNTVWARTFGGTKADYAYSVIQTGDGGFAIAGGTASHGRGDADFHVIRTDTVGKLLWARTFGDTSGDYAESIIQTRDGGFAIAGWTWSAGAGKYDFLVIRTDAAGNLLWARTFGGAGSDYVRSIIQTADGGFAIAGTIFGSTGNCDALVLRLDSLGNLVWARTIGGQKNDEVFSVIQAPDGSLVVAGDMESFGVGNWDCLVFRMEMTGNLLWARTFGGKDTDWAYSVARTKEGGFAVGRWTKSSGAGADDFLDLMLDEKGNCPGCVLECSPEVMAHELTVFSPGIRVADCNLSVGEPELIITRPELTAKDACDR